MNATATMPAPENFFVDFTDQRVFDLYSVAGDRHPVQHWNLTQDTERIFDKLVGMAEQGHPAPYHHEYGILYYLKEVK